MIDAPDAVLLEKFAGNDSEDAFTEIVRRHVGLVHSVARRHTQNAQQAEEITQAVFIILARKASSLGRKTILSGWLYHTARLTAANFQRAEIRRVRREQEAYMDAITQSQSNDVIWDQLAPVLDEAMAQLRDKDRDAIVLRYFENKSLREVGMAMGLEERAAQKRVARGLEKLRAFFTKREIVLSTTLIAGAVSANSVKAAPPALAASVKTVALAKGSAAGTSTWALVKGALKVMAWTKAKTTMVVTVVVLLAVGTTAEILKTSGAGADEQTIEESLWQANSRVLYKVPPVLIIRPTKFAGTPEGLDAGDRAIMLDAPISRLLSVAYRIPETRLVLPDNLSKKRFDLMLTVSNRPREALQEKIKRKFGLVAHHQVQMTNILLLEMRDTNAPGFKLIRPGDHVMSAAEAQSEGARLSALRPRGWMIIPNTSMQNFLVDLEFKLKQQIKDETGISNHFEVRFQWQAEAGESENDAFKRAVLEQLGFDLVPTNKPIDILVVEKSH